MTDEQLLRFVERGEDRIAKRAHAEFAQAVEAVRVGYSAARDKKALRQWQRIRDRGTGRKVGLTGAALENAIAGLAATHPEYVVTG